MVTFLSIQQQAVYFHQRAVIKKQHVFHAVQNKFRRRWSIKPYLAKLRMQQAGMSDEAMHSPDRRNKKDTQSNRQHDTTNQTSQTAGAFDLTVIDGVYGTRGSRGESFCRTRSCCSILLLLQLQVLLLTWCEDFPDREERQV